MIGQRLPVATSGNAVSIAGAGLVATDIRCSNGIIHVIDSVMMPEKRPIPSVAKSAGSFGTLLAAAKAAGLVDTLSGEGPLTVLAPTDEAFAKLMKGSRCPPSQFVPFPPRSFDLQRYPVAIAVFIRRSICRHRMPDLDLDAAFSGDCISSVDDQIEEQLLQSRSICVYQRLSTRIEYDLDLRADQATDLFASGLAPPVPFLSRRCPRVAVKQVVVHDRTTPQIMITGPDQIEIIE